MTCFWTKHHPISQLVTYFFTCFLLLFLLSFAQLNFSQNCVIFIALCAGNVLSRNRCILEYCLVRCHSLFCNRKRLVATITSAGHTRSIIDFAHKLDMANWRKRRVFFQCCRMSTPLIDWLIGEAVERAGRVGAGRRASRGAINGAPAACSCRDAACGRRGRGVLARSGEGVAKGGRCGGRASSARSVASAEAVALCREARRGWDG